MRLQLWGLLALLAAAPLMAGCSTPFAKAPVQVPPGWIFQETRAPLSINYDETAANPGKHGAATITYICGWPLIFNSSFANGDAGIKAAAQNGNINEVAYADYETYNVLGIYSRFTVHAYGN